MAHNLNMKDGRASIAFRGSRSDVWHQLGQEAQEGWTVDQWASNAGLAWTAEKSEAYASLLSPSGDRMVRADGWRFITRSDNGHVLGCVSDRYQPVQPRDVLDWFQKYISVDDRFQLDVAGALKEGEIIWATATYNSEMDVAGDKHTARLLMTTTFDGTGSTINRATMTRVVCNNTLDCALADKQKSLVRTRHRTKFNPDRVAAELATIAQGFEAYKAMGDAMAGVAMTNEQLSRYFKAVLDIPFDAKAEDVSTRKKNQFADLAQRVRRDGARGHAGRDHVDGAQHRDALRRPRPADAQWWHRQRRGAVRLCSIRLWRADEGASRPGAFCNERLRVDSRHRWPDRGRAHGRR